MKEKIRSLVKDKKFWTILVGIITVVAVITCVCTIAAANGAFEKKNVGDLNIILDETGGHLETFGDGNYKITESGKVVALITPMKLAKDEYVTTIKDLAQITFPTYQNIKPSYSESPKAWVVIAYDVAASEETNSAYALYSEMILPKDKKAGKYSYIVQFPYSEGTVMSPEVYGAITNAIYNKYMVVAEEYSKLQNTLQALYASAFAEPEATPEEVE